MPGSEDRALIRDIDAFLREQRDGTYTLEHLQAAAKGLYAAIRARSRADLLGWLEEHGAGRARGFVVTMPCGQAVRFDSLDAVPDADLPCPCGNPHELVIRYVDA